MNRKSLFVIAVFGSLGPVANAQSQPTTTLGGTYGIYYPSDKIIQKAFGKTVTNLGISPVSSSRPSSGSLTPSIDVTSADSNGNKLFIGTLTYGYEYHLGDDTGSTVPYARLFGGGSYFDYGIDQPGARHSAKRIGITYGAELGIVIASKLKLSARYNIYSKEDLFSFNGLTLNATYALFSL